jgi:hypothetical protein
MLSRSVSSVTGKSTAQGRPFFCNHDGFFRWQFLNDLAQLGLNCAQTFDLHNSNSFAPINNTLPFAPDELHDNQLLRVLLMKHRMFAQLRKSATVTEKPKKNR